MKDQDPWLVSFLLGSRRSEAVDEIQGSPFSLIEHAAQVLTDHAEGHQLHAAEKQDNDHHRGITLDRIAVSEGLVDDEQRVGE